MDERLKSSKERVAYLRGRRVVASEIVRCRDEGILGKPEWEHIPGRPGNYGYWLYGTDIEEGIRVKINDYVYRGVKSIIVGQPCGLVTLDTDNGVSAMSNAVGICSFEILGA